MTDKNVKQNLHTHTNYVDGKDMPEEIVLEAIERNFDSIGFSEHAHLPYSKYPNQLTEDKAEQYKSEIKSLKRKYEGKIDLFCGLEYDFYSDTDTEGYDYLIGSVHYLEALGDIVTFDSGLEETRDYINEYFGGRGLAFAKKYFETLARLPEKCSFDILGHFDLITKNNGKGRFFDTSSAEYISFGLEAIHALRGKIPLFEVNTGAVARGYKSSPYPELRFLKEFKDCGFGAVITSDCHNKSFLDCHFDEAREFLSAAGFSTRWVLTENGFREVEL